MMQGFGALWLAALTTAFVFRHVYLRARFVVFHVQALPVRRHRGLVLKPPPPTHGRCVPTHGVAEVYPVLLPLFTHIT